MEKTAEQIRGDLLRPLFRSGAGYWLAAARDPLRRSHHGFRTVHRRNHSHLPPWPALALLLAGAVPQRTPYLAQLSLAPAVGFFRHSHLSDRQRDFPLSADRSRCRRGPRSGPRLAPKALRPVVAGLARQSAPMASPGKRHAYHGHRHHSRGCFCTYDRLLGFRHDAGAHVALYDLWALLRLWRNLQRRRGADSGHGLLAKIPTPRRVFGAHPFRPSRQAPPNHEPALVLLHLR